MSGPASEEDAASVHGYAGTVRKQAWIEWSGPAVARAGSEGRGRLRVGDGPGPVVAHVAQWQAGGGATQGGGQRRGVTRRGDLERGPGR